MTLFPTELTYNIISWVLVNNTHSISVLTGDVIWEKNILCDVSPVIQIAMEIVAKAFLKFQMKKKKRGELQLWIILSVTPEWFPQTTTCNIATDLRTPSSARGEAG